MQEKYNQVFRYARLIAKSAGFTFTLFGIVLFIVHFLPTYRGIAFWFFIIGACLWTLDTMWSTLDSWKEIGRDIKEHRLS